MKGINWLLIGGAAYLTILLGSSSKDTIKANSIRAQILDIDLDWQRIRITLNVQNPTAGNIVVRAVVGDLYVNGDKVANVFYSGYTSIPAAGQNKFQITGTYIVQNMGRFLYDMFNGRKRMTLDFRGSANVNSALVPLDITKTING